MSYKFDPFFNGIGPKERWALHEEESRAVRVDAARARAAVAMVGVDRTRLLAAVAAAAEATVHETGQVDWRAAIASLIDPTNEHTSEALDRLVRASAAEVEKP